MIYGGWDGRLWDGGLISLFLSSHSFSFFFFKSHLRLILLTLQVERWWEMRDEMVNWDHNFNLPSYLSHKYLFVGLQVVIPRSPQQAKVRDGRWDGGWLRERYFLYHLIYHHLIIYHLIIYHLIFSHHNFRDYCYLAFDLKIHLSSLNLKFFIEWGKMRWLKVRWLKVRWLMVDEMDGWWNCGWDKIINHQPYIISF